MEKVKGIKLSKAFFVSMDIESLYTNTETEMGLAAVMKCFKKYLDKDRPEMEILRLLEMSLSKND